MSFKIMRYLRLSALIIAVALSSACLGNTRKAATALQYLNDETVLSIKLPEVPDTGSALFESDFKTLHEWQEKRSEGDCIVAKKNADYDFRSMFPSLKDFYENLPAVNREFLDSVGDETAIAVKLMKKKYNRARPYVTDPTLLPCVDKPGKSSRAYPSGHSTRARVYALLLTELMPKRRSEFLTRADIIGLDRVVGGVHHPTDIEAGRRFANALFAKYMQNKLFRANVNNLRQYLPKN